MQCELLQRCCEAGTAFDVVCYGLGRLSSCSSAQYQFAALTALTQDWKVCRETPCLDMCVYVVCVCIRACVRVCVLWVCLCMYCCVCPVNVPLRIGNDEVGFPSLFLRWAVCGCMTLFYLRMSCRRWSPLAVCGSQSMSPAVVLCPAPLSSSCSTVIWPCTPTSWGPTGVGRGCGMWPSWGIPSPPTISGD